MSPWGTTGGGHHVDFSAPVILALDTDDVLQANLYA